MAQIIADPEGMMTAMTLEVGSWAPLSLDRCSAKGSDNSLGRRAVVTIERTDPSWPENKRDCNQTLLPFTPTVTSAVAGQGKLHTYRCNQRISAAA